MRDPLSGWSTPARLWLSALLCLAPMGLTWRHAYLTPGYTLFGTCGYTTEGICTLDRYLPGHVVDRTTVSTSPLRIFLLFAAVVFIAAALLQRTAATRVLAGWAAAGIGIAFVLALGHSSPRVAVLLAGALLAVGPLVWGPAPPVLRRFGFWPRARVEWILGACRPLR